VKILSELIKQYSEFPDKTPEKFVELANLKYLAFWMMIDLGEAFDKKTF